MTDCKPVNSGIADLTGAQVVIDLKILVSNWKFLQTQFSGKFCGAAVKANAYGIGIEPVVLALYSAGCRYFFVALPEEGGNRSKTRTRCSYYCSQWITT